MGLQIYLLYAPMSIYCVGYAFTVIYLLLDARNLQKYMLLLFIFFVLRHIALLLASLMLPRNCSLAGAHSSQHRLILYLHHTSSVLQQLPLELLSEIFNEGGINIISPSNIRPIIIYFHSSQCRLIPYLHQNKLIYCHHFRTYSRCAMFD